MGIDIGSTTSKGIILKDGKEIIASTIIPSGTGTKGPQLALESLLNKSQLKLENIDFSVSTGYGRGTFAMADHEVSELSCHARGVYFTCPDVRTIIDIGGQDVKVLSITEQGKMQNFLMNDKCAAGTGRFLDVMASILQLNIEDLGRIAERSDKPISISNTCTVFAESEVISQLALGVELSDLVAGICESVARRVSSLAKRISIREKVTTSLFESAIFNMGMMVQAAQYKGIGKTYPIDVREADNPFNTAWLTSDGRYIQTCMPDYNTYYNKFMAAIGREDLVDNENYFPVQNMQAKNLGTEVYDIVTEAMKKKTVLEWKEILTEADIPFSVAQSWEEILEDEQAWANNCFYKMKYDNGNERTLVCLPVKFAEMGRPEYNRGPLIGEHGPEILKSIGYTDEEIEELIDRKALYVWDDKDNKLK